ncbi:cardiolipin synthase [Acetobacterium woodii]|uniref:Cardiolipin synthase n=1 Tax=Acetobacterium woodii (strain ATCC 29683 / DSM 1030 / JCM 2381 / KCTC 1655 / WB1) TaxID=931626 RepID=H6LG84_ACEWD|nr:cardiolipin synthase [Acetobacterium woodii]AFA49560.1 cardiolipin synthetase YwnE [Acetobacterium woodii DSM 1030]
MFLGITATLTALFFIVNIPLTFTIIFLERKNPQSTYAWLLFLWMVPLLGFLFYIFFSQNLTKRKIFKYNTPENFQYQHLLRQQKRSLSRIISIDPDSPIERYRHSIEFHLNVSESIYTNNNEVEIFTDGHKKFEALFHAMEEAHSSIHIEYYIIKNDALSKKLFDILTRKALGGVEVRLLFDAMGGRYIPNAVLEAFKSAGGQIGIFFPSRFKMLNLRINYRNHRKIAVIDGNIGFVGGFNIGNEYLGMDKNMGYWRDTHLKIKGSAAYELQHRFLLDWRASSSEELLIDDLKLNSYFPNIPQKSGSGVQIVSSGPDNVNQQIKQGFLRMINTAENYILIQSPYFVPDESILEALKIALLSGIDVRIMIPNKPDHIFIYWVTLAYVGELIEYGAKIYIYENGFLHAKTIVVDDAVCSVGSCNFDIRSFRLNFETNAFIYDRNISIQLKNIFVEDIKKCTYYNKELYHNRSRRVKIKESISRLFSPLL